MPVQSPDDCKILFKKTLFKILQDCNAAFVLGQQQILEELLEGTGDRTSKYFSALLQSTSAEWLYEDCMQVYTTVGVGPQHCPQGVEEEIEEEEPELDRAQPQEVAFLQYTISGEELMILHYSDSAPTSC